MNQSPEHRVGLLAAALLAVAPLGFGLFRALQTRDDYRMFWMALVASLFAAGVMAASIGRRRSRHAIYNQSAVILVVSTLLAGGTGFLLGARTGPGVWLVALVLGFCLAVSGTLAAISRPESG